MSLTIEKVTRSARYDRAQVTIYNSNNALGAAAADDLATILNQTIATHGEAAVILATGNSQLAFLRALCSRADIDWGSVRVFHMDEYLGMSEQHPASFRRYLHQHLIDIVRPREFYGIAGDAPDVGAELLRYTKLLNTYKPVACVLGIGENGHLAFNDPPADFNSDQLIHIVTLAETCRQQQVGEGHFPTLEAVPRQAISLTIPALLMQPHVLAVVPEARKAHAVHAALEAPVTPDCPASILRTVSHVKLYLDPDSAALLQQVS
jgi:glucosamine-6-phosphate deaminase